MLLKNKIYEGNKAFKKAYQNGECILQVVDVLQGVKGVELSESAITVDVSGTSAPTTFQLTATVLPPDAQDKSVVWSSSDDSIATVDQNGLVTAVGEGDCVITVTTVDGGKTDTCSVHSWVHVTSVNIISANTAYVGDYVKICYEVLPLNADDKSVTWTSSDETVATVGTDGVATVLATGSSIITVTTVEGSFTDQYTLTVDEIDESVPLTINAEEDSTIVVSKNGTLRYSKDNGDTWNVMPITGITLEKGESAMLRGSLTPTPETSGGVATFKESTGAFKVYGNIMSLLFNNNFSGQTSLSGYDWAFNKLFSGCTNTLTDAEGLLLPAETLSTRCYSNMFRGCRAMRNTPKSVGTSATTMVNTESACCYMFASTNIVTGPELPSLNLGATCYHQMFKECHNLRNAPVLPATTVVSNCYGYMFHNCTSLERAPYLPAPTLAYACYFNMFYGCSKLNYVRCLATDISASQATTNWLSGVASGGIFQPASTPPAWTMDSESGVPSGWYYLPV